jgi:hypothetical protein
MNIGRQHQRTEFQWHMANMNYQRNMSELQFGFSMIDADEEIRYATGRQKRVAMRHRDQAVISHSMEMSHLDVEQDRAKTRQKWEEEQFQREKDHFERNVQFQKEEMELSRKHFLEDMNLSRQRFELEKQQYQKRIEFINEERRLEDEQRAVQRAAHAVELQEKQEIMNFNQMIKRTMDDLSGAGKIADTELRKAQASLQYLTSTSQYLSKLNPDFVTLNSTLVTMKNTVTDVSNAVGSVYHDVSQYLARMTYEGNELLRQFHVRHGAGGFGGHNIDGEGYEAGGHTGTGNPKTKAGEVHKEEYVIPAPGAPVVFSSRIERAIRDMHDTLREIHADGGNATINVNVDGAPRQRRKESFSLFGKTLR